MVQIYTHMELKQIYSSKHQRYTLAKTKQHFNVHLISCFRNRTLRVDYNNTFTHSAYGLLMIKKYWNIHDIHYLRCKIKLNLTFSFRLALVFGIWYLYISTPLFSYTRQWIWIITWWYLPRIMLIFSLFC